MSSSDEHGEHVVLIVDCSDDTWTGIGEKAEQEVAPTRRCNGKVALESIHLLESGIKLFHADNRTTIIAASTQPKIVSSVKQCAEHLVTGNVSIVSALTKALLVINRHEKDKASGDATTETRIIVITATRIPANDFVTCMNCAFAAQKMGVVVDVVDYSQSSTPELLQLVHHTNGWYLSLAPKDGEQGVLAHALVTNFVASASARRYLNPPTCPATDMRTICYCHQNNLISIGYVCSVCLHVFCERRNVCTACNSKVALRKRG